MGAVSALLGKLATDVRLVNEGVSVAWVNTGGGCMAISVEFGDTVAPHVRKYEILITDRDDIFGGADRFNDDDVSGFHALLRVFQDDSGDDVYGDRDPVIVYRTSDDAGLCASSALGSEPVVKLAVEVTDAWLAVRRVVVAVMRGERWGRSVEVW